MKKLIFCCLVVLMGACKDDKKDPEPEVDHASGFVGVYKTTTVGTGTTNHEWKVTTEAKNQLSIAYTKKTEIAIGGTTLKLTQEYPLTKVKVTGADSFEINEEVDVTQSNGEALKQKVAGIGTKVVNANGVPQLNITLKLVNSSTGAAQPDEYLEFKKQP
jgi:hypothetical protein